MNLKFESVQKRPGKREFPCCACWSGSKGVRTIVEQSRSAGMAVPRRKRPAASTERTQVSKDTLKEGARMLKPARKLRRR